MWSGKRFSRVRRIAPLAGVAALLGAACSGRSVSRPPDADAAGFTGSSGGSAGSGGKAGRGGGGGGLAAGTAGKAGTGGTGEVPFEDPGCPDIPPPAAVIECDVFDTGSPCGEGFACKPRLEHPFGTGCDQQVLNMYCVLPGAGEQGDACENGMSECAEGFICVVGAAQGANCLQMCAPGGSIQCASGYVCNLTDADGIGVCS
jgi:hypothetical protein